MTHDIIPKVGMRVHVLSPDQKENWGLGTITKVEPLDVFDKEKGCTERWMENYPKEITLDSGEITEGLKCWWCVYKEKKH